VGVTVGGHRVQVVLVVVMAVAAEAELEHQPVQAVLAQHAEDLGVALGMAGEAARDELAGGGSQRDGARDDAHERSPSGRGARPTGAPMLVTPVLTRGKHVRSIPIPGRRPVLYHCPSRHHWPI
jgi:hypothetical protein